MLTAKKAKQLTDEALTENGILGEQLDRCLGWIEESAVNGHSTTHFEIQASPQTAKRLAKILTSQPYGYRVTQCGCSLTISWFFG